jgi:hypothetical protein
MIIYNQAFDLYHAIFRMLQLLYRVDDKKLIDIDRLRIWDFYLLFPNEIYNIKPKKHEVDFKKRLKQLTVKKDNPYQKVFDNRKTLEKIKPYQLSALHCLASYGIIDKSSLFQDRILIKSTKLLKEHVEAIGSLSSREQNIITIVTSDFYDVSMIGKDGLKNRSNLIESKYDAE